MATAREVKLRIRSVKNITQVTRALQAVSASRVRRAMDAVTATRPYALKAWQVLTHIAGQPGRESLHPLLTKRMQVDTVTVIMISGDRGLAGAYNSNILRFSIERFTKDNKNVRFITIGRKGRDLLIRLRKTIIAEFSNIPEAPSFADVSAIGHLAVEEFLTGNSDEVHVVYTDFINMLTQKPVDKKLLPLEFETTEGLVEEFGMAQGGPKAAYIYEPDQMEIMDAIVPQFTELQVYQAILESQASEHAARMVAMKNATDNATELAASLQLAYNNARQQSITSEMLDIVGGAEALSHS